MKVKSFKASSNFGSPAASPLRHVISASNQLHLRRLPKRISDLIPPSFRIGCRTAAGPEFPGLSCCATEETDHKELLIPSDGDNDDDDDNDEKDLILTPHYPSLRDSLSSTTPPSCCVVSPLVSPLPQCLSQKVCRASRLSCLWRFAPCDLGYIPPEAS